MLFTQDEVRYFISEKPVKDDLVDLPIDEMDLGDKRSAIEVLLENCPPDLDSPIKQCLDDLLTEFVDCISCGPLDLGCVPQLVFDIQLVDPGNPPCVDNSYRFSHAESLLIQEHVTKLIAHGLIENSVSTWRSPLVIAPKADGSERICENFRKLNRRTAIDPFPMPRVDDLIDWTGGASCFSKIDFASGFWQIEIEEGSRPFTAFSTPSGHYQWTRMPFGLVNAPAMFCRLAKMMMSEMPSGSAVQYIDDVLLKSDSALHMLSLLRCFFVVLRTFNVKLKPAKTFLMQSVVEFLGHQVSSAGIQPKQSLAQAIVDFPTPTTAREVQSFVGLGNWYQRFIPNFSVLSKPLRELYKGRSGVF
jgi:hypothetical protein